MSIKNMTKEDLELLSNKEAIKHEVNNALEYQKQICIKSIKEFRPVYKWGFAHKWARFSVQSIQKFVKSDTYS